jgi:hypothetical protein
MGEGREQTTLEMTASSPGCTPLLQELPCCIPCMILTKNIRQNCEKKSRLDIINNGEAPDKAHGDRIMQVP